MTSIYVLRCDKSKFYIGRTKDVENRDKQHMTHKGSEFTKQFTEIERIKTYSNKDNYDEDVITLKMMGIFGIENVRGGSFVKVNLPKSEVQTLEKMISHHNPSCDYCDDAHYLGKCPKIEMSILDIDGITPKDTINIDLIKYKEKVITKIKDLKIKKSSALTELYNEKIQYIIIEINNNYLVPQKKLYDYIQNKYTIDITNAKLSFYETNDVTKLKQEIDVINELHTTIDEIDKTITKYNESINLLEKFISEVNDKEMKIKKIIKYIEEIYKNSVLVPYHDLFI